MNVQEQERKLLALVDEYRDRECRKQIEQAHNTRREMIRNAYRDAREHLHEAAERERAHAISQIRSAEAELHTKRRAVEQRDAELFLKEGWQLLKQGLLEQWKNGEGRLAWLESCATEALKRLPGAHWTVQHPSNCTQQQLGHFSNLISRDSTNITIDAQVAPDMEAGLRIGTDNTWLDMSLEGLLRDRKGVEARMLALLNRSEQV